MANYPVIYRYRSSTPRRYASQQRPYSIFDHMQREMSDMFNRAQSLIDTDEGEGQGSGAFFTPSIDSHESESEYRLSLELPGVKRDDVELTVENGHITISGEKRSRYEQSDDSGSRTETRYGRFQRILPLPEGVDEDAIEANFEDGVLELTLPKAEEAKAQGRKIEIGDRHTALPASEHGSSEGNGAEASSASAETSESESEGDSDSKAKKKAA